MHGAYRKLEVWQDAMHLMKGMGNIQITLRESKQFELQNQLLRSAISIPSNIAEGANSGSNKNFARYIDYSLGSIAEFQTQLEIGVLWEVIPVEQMKELNLKTDRLAYRLRKLKKHLLQQY